MASVITMTEGSIGKKMLALSVPLICSNLLQVLFNLSDLAVAGQFAGSSALGAVGSTTQIVSLFTLFIIGLSSGVNALTARFIGANRSRDISETVHTGFIVMLIVGLLTLLLGFIGSGALLRLLSTKDDLYDQAHLYLRIYFLGLPALSIYNFGNAVFSALGNTKKPLAYLAFAGVVNVCLNLFFVIVCHLDVAGVAIASAISQYLSAFLIINALFKDKGMCRLHFSSMKITGDKVKLLLMLGLPAGLQNVIFTIANMFVQSGVNSFSTTIVEGNSAAANADNIVYEIMNAFYVAGASFISQNYGAKKRDRVLKSYFSSVGFAFISSLTIGFFLFFFGREFLFIFTSEEAVVEAGLMRLKIMAFSYAFSAFMDGTIAASRGLGHTIVPTIIVIMGSCVFRIIWIYTIFAYFHTIQSLYALYIFSWAITATAEIICFAINFKKDPILRRAA